MKYFKRKAAIKDFTPDDLPKTRKAQFLSILKTDYFTLFKLGLLLLLFLLPKLAVDLARVNVLNGILSTYSGDEQKSMIVLTQLIYGLLSIVSLLILSIGLSGIFNIYKRIIWGKPIFLKEDFSQGLKNNLKQYLLISLISSSISYLCILVEIFNQSNIIVQSIAYGINMVVFIPIFYEFLLVTAFYKNSFGKALINSGILCFRTYPFTISTLAILYLFYFVNFIPYVIIALFVKIVLIVILVPVALLYGFLGQVYKFDQIINRENYPEIYKNGIN